MLGVSDAPRGRFTARANRAAGPDPEDCVICDGDGVAKDPFCEGKGKLTCEKCRGTGEVPAPAPA